MRHVFFFSIELAYLLATNVSLHILFLNVRDVKTGTC